MTYFKTALLLFALLFVGQQSYSQTLVAVKDVTQKYRFDIILLDGQTISPEEEIEVNSTVPLRKLVYSDKTYTPEETARILVHEKDDRMVRGVPLDSIWIFKTHSTQDTHFFSYLPQQGSDYVVSCLLEDSASLDPLSKEVMSKVVKGNTKAAKELEKNNVRKALDIYLKDEAKKEKELKKMEDKLNKRIAKEIVRQMFR